MTAKNEEQRRWEGDLFRLLVENVKDYAIFILSPEGLVLSWSLGASRLLGYQEEEIIGQHYSRFFLPAEITAGEPDKEMQQAVRLGRGEDDRWHVRKDGTLFWSSGVMTPLRDAGGKLRGYAKIMRDLTDKQLQEDARQRLLLEHGYSTLVVVDKSATITYATPSCRHILGFEPEEIVGRNAMEFIHPDHLTMAREKLASVAGRPKSNVQTELQVRRKDGAWRWFTAKGTNLLDAPAVRGIVIDLHDITERREAEQRLLLREREMEEANRQLRETSQIREEFLAVLSHELRNPLASVTSGVELLEHDGLSEETKGVVTTIREGLQLTNRLLEELLQANRVATGRIPLRRSIMELGPVIERAVRAMQHRAESDHRRISLLIDPEPTWINADASRIEQIALNLIDNAIKYTDTGGRISVNVRREGNAAVLSVRDTGMGIEPEVMPHIFSPFVRGTRALQRGDNGHGIGLAFVRRLVEMHDGVVEARSEGMDRGSEFIVKFPATSPPADEGQPSEEKTEQDSKALKVMIVDDNRMSADLMGMLLQRLGHEAAVVYDGESAVEKAPGFMPDIVMMDIGLPGMDGYETARRLRQKMGEGVHIVAVTGYGQESDRERSQEAGFNVHLVKPVGLSQIRELLQPIAQRKAA